MSGRVGALCVLVLAAAMTAPAGSAQARSSVFLSIGPVFPAFPPYHRHYYGYPPPVYVVPPPPVVYYEPVPAPPPAVVFTQPPAIQPPAIQANPAGPAYVARNGQLCREYQTTITVGGVPQAGYGTACRQADGSWRVVN